MDPFSLGSVLRGPSLRIRDFLTSMVRFELSRSRDGHAELLHRKNIFIRSISEL